MAGYLCPLCFSDDPNHQCTGKSKAKITGFKPLIITGSWLTKMLQASAHPYEDCAYGGVSLTCPQVLAIIKNKAHIEGDSEKGLEYVDVKEGETPQA